MELHGHTAIVTGGASGLGEATAKTLAARGVRVAVFDLNTNFGQTIATEIGGAFHAVDVRDEANVISAMDAVVEELGAPRILVNCAGYPLAQRTVTKDGPHSLDSFRDIVDVHLTGTFNCIRLFAERLIEMEALEDGERGVVINTASVAAHEGQGGQAAYSAAKAGIVGLTLPVARDLAHFGIRVNTISPGMFWTAPAENAPEKLVESLRSLLLFPNRFGRPEEFADFVRQICENVMLNGAVLRLDGAIRLV